MQMCMYSEDEKSFKVPNPELGKVSTSAKMFKHCPRALTAEFQFQHMGNKGLNPLTYAEASAWLNCMPGVLQQASLTGKPWICSWEFAHNIQEAPFLAPSAWLNLLVWQLTACQLMLMGSYQFS